MSGAPDEPPESPQPSLGDDPLGEVLASLPPGAKLCGNCMVWRPMVRSPEGRWIGPCRLQPGRGDLPSTAAICERFLPRGSRVPTAPPVEQTRRRAVTLRGPELRRPGVPSSIPSPRPAAPDVELGDLLAMTRNELIELLRDALGEGPPPDLASKWEGGSVVLKPGNPELQAKEIPLDQLFNKVVMIRDRMRVLEAKLNAHPKLSSAEKIELQGYITKCYGSLTTFNVLFREKADHFVGERGGRDD